MGSIPNKVIWALIGVCMGVLVLFDLSRPVHSGEQYIAVQLDIGKQLYFAGGIPWKGDVPAEITVAYYNVNDNGAYFTAGYSHQSNLLSGPPFNQDAESVLDKVYIVIYR